MNMRLDWSGSVLLAKLSYNHCQHLGVYEITEQFVPEITYSWFIYIQHSDKSKTQHNK